jgi:hypothetical protein
LRVPLCIPCAAAALLLLAGCESTIDQAKKIAKNGKVAFEQHGLTVTAIDRQIRVVRTAVISDASGTAVVVELRNSGPRAIIDAPIAINVSDREGRSIFRNNLPGLEEDLDHVPLLLPGQVFDWVNDQVLPNGTPARVAARVGTGPHAPASLPKIEVSGVTLTDDPVSGYAASGHVFNASHLPQVNLVLFAIARRAGRIVAAGRAILPRLAPDKSAIFHAYFTGNPNRAQLSVLAPPSVLP